MMVQKQNLDNCVNRAGVNHESSAHGRDGVNPEHHPTVIKRSGTTETTETTERTELKFKVGSLNVGTMRGRSGEVVETLTRRKIDICCVQEVRWRGASARMITGKDSEYKMFWVGSKTGLGGVGILVSREWIEKIVDVKRVNERLMHDDKDIN